jgi:hypothetical protein
MGFTRLLVFCEAIVAGVAYGTPTTGSCGATAQLE